MQKNGRGETDMADAVFLTIRWDKVIALGATFAKLYLNQRP